MFDMQRYHIGQEMIARMNELTADVKTEINTEREERFNALRDVNQNLKMMDDKMTKELERRDRNVDEARCRLISRPAGRTRSRCVARPAGWSAGRSHEL